MPNIVIVEKSGTLKSLSIKIYNESELYKKAGFKSNEGFKCFHNWNIVIVGKKYNISLYGKTIGKANQENKYDFPPPIDNLLFFNNCVLVNKNSDTGELFNLSISEWESIYDHLFGGFSELEDANSENDDLSEDDDDIDTTKLTTTGYIKDDFVVEDDEDEDDPEDEDEDEEEPDDDDADSIELKKKKIKAPLKVNKKKTKPACVPTLVNIFEPVVEKEYNYLGCTSELTEEEYI